MSPSADQAGRSLLVFVLASVLLMNYVDRGVLPTAAQLIQEELHLTASQLGLPGSAFFWTYALAQIPVGWLAEHIGAERVLAMAVPAESLRTANGIVGFAYLFGPAVGAYAGGLLMARFGWRSSNVVQYGARASAPC